MTIVWSEPYLADNRDTMIRGRMDGRKMVARLSQEAIEDQGFDECKALAERKVLAAVSSGRSRTRSW